MGAYTLQQVFMVFYAIFWGAVASAQSKWKPFQLPLLSRPWRKNRINNRVMFSMVMFNLLPLVFFGYVLCMLEGKTVDNEHIVRAAGKIIVNAILPASAVFGFYRFWLGIVECKPQCFYYSKDERKGLLDEKYWHVEPVYRTSHDIGKTATDMPFVDLGDGTGLRNVLWACVYILIGLVAPLG